MVGIAGGCLPAEPIVALGDSVIRVSENVSEDVNFPSAEGIVESITESVTVQVT